MTHFFLNKKMDKNTPIFRYLDMDSFLQILNGEFYVSKKKRFVDNFDAGIIRKTKCFRIWERNAIISKTKRNFSRLYPTPQNFKKIDRLRRNEIHLKAVRTPS